VTDKGKAETTPMSDRIDTDAVLHKFMLQIDPEKSDHQVDLEGDLYRTTVEKQREEKDAPKIIAELLGETEKHIFIEKAFHRTCSALGLGTNLIAAGIETIGKAFETVHEGEQLNDATKREYAVGAVLTICASALPEDFGPSLHLKVVGKGTMQDGASHLLQAIDKSPEAAQIRDGIIANCRDGQRYLIDRHIGSQAELSATLKQNPDFAARYEHDLAFKLGADSVVWAAGHDALPALANQLPAAPAAAQLEVRG
jgi:hypothetical protein